MEFVFGAYDTKYFLRRKKFEETLVILLLQFLELQIVLVMVFYGSCASLFVGFIDVCKAFVFKENGEHALSHFAIDGKEACCFNGRQACLGGNETFEFGLKFLGVETLLLCKGGEYGEQTEADE